MLSLGVDIIAEISKFLDPRGLCNFICTCKTIYLASRNVYYKVEAKYVNHLTKLIQLYPNANWDWKYVSANANITMEFVVSNPGMPWDFKAISANPNITPEFIMTTPGVLQLLDMSLLSKNKAIPLQFILANTSLEWDEYEVTSRDDVNINIIKAATKFPWRVGAIWCHENISLDEKMSLFQSILPRNLDWATLNIKDPDEMKISGYMNSGDIKWLRTVSPKLIDNYPNIPWDEVADMMPDHPDLTIDILKKHKFMWFSGNTKNRAPLLICISFMYNLEDWYINRDDITPELLTKLDIDYRKTDVQQIFLCNKNFDFELFKTFNKNTKELVMYQTNPGLTFRDMINNPEVPWDFQIISKNEFQRTIGYPGEHIERRLEK